jgi:hypothetical protein
MSILRMKRQLGSAFCTQIDIEEMEHAPLPRDPLAFSLVP